MSWQFTRGSEDGEGAKVGNGGIIIALCAVAAVVGSAAIYTLGVVVTKNSMQVPLPPAPVPPPPAPRETQVSVGVQDTISNAGTVSGATIAGDGTAVTSDLASPNQWAHSPIAQGPPVPSKGSVRSDGGEDGRDETVVKKENGSETPVPVEAIGDQSTTTTTRMRLWKIISGVGAVGAAGAGYSIYQQHAALQAGFDKGAYTKSCKYECTRLDTVYTCGRLHTVWSDDDGNVVVSRVDPDCAGHDDGSSSRTATSCLIATVCCLMFGAATLSLSLRRQRQREHSAIQLAGVMAA